MKAILVNYSYSPLWLYDYPEFDVTLYDRSDDGVERNLTLLGQVIRTPNIGDVDYDKLTWLVENYHNLPDVFLWGKSNLFKFVEEQDFKKALQANVFQPLLKYNHATYSDQFGVVSRYAGPIYEERNDNWLVHNGDLAHSSNFSSWQDWAHRFMLPSPAYIPFAPGGNYLLTRERVHRYSKDLYDEMRSYLPYAQRPIEAHWAERSYYMMWK